MISSRRRITVRIVPALILTIGLALVAGSIWRLAETNRFEIAAEQASLYRLDRWTGLVELCVPRRGDSPQTIAVDCDGGRRAKGVVDSTESQ